MHPYRERGVFRHPRAIDHVAAHDHSLLVQEIDPHVLAEVLERHPRRACAAIGERGPGLERLVVRDAPFERQRLELRQAGRGDGMVRENCRRDRGSSPCGA